MANIVHHSRPNPLTEDSPMRLIFLLAFTSAACAGARDAAAGKADVNADSVAASSIGATPAGAQTPAAPTGNLEYGAYARLMTSTAAARRSTQLISTGASALDVRLPVGARGGSLDPDRSTA